jgi:MoaA/NifB/PqqE/SkfB family radical SAM enzyme
MRGTPIAFERANNALSYLAQCKQRHAENSGGQPENQLNILAAFLLTSLNIDEAEEYIRHMSEKKIWVTIQSLDTNIQPLIQGKYFQEEVGGGTKSSLWIQDKEKVRQFFARAREMKRQGYLVYNRSEQLANMERYYLEEFSEIKKIPCYAGQQNFIISHNGDVFLCFKGPSVGNILQQTAVEIWGGASARETRKLMKTCPRLCRIMNCNYNNSLLTKAREYVGSRM